MPWLAEGRDGRPWQIIGEADGLFSLVIQWFLSDRGLSGQLSLQKLVKQIVQANL